MADEKVMLGHGSGGSMMKRIIDEVFFEATAPMSFCAAMTRRCCRPSRPASDWLIPRTASW